MWRDDLVFHSYPASIDYFGVRREEWRQKAIGGGRRGKADWINIGPYWG